MFHAPWLLVGLAVLVIPPIIHLLNRRRHDVVDWGAMQFLKVSDAVRRRMMIEELLLMLLRMALLAVLVVALAGPFLDVKLPSSLVGRPPRDVVLVIDGSASMGALDDTGTSPAARAIAWADRLLGEMQQGDAAAVVMARERSIPLTGELSADLGRARRLVSEMPPPGGTCNWAESIRVAFALLSPSQKARREVILLSDNQAFGVADQGALFRWELLASELGLHLPEPEGRPWPRITFVDLTGDRPSSLPNYAVGPLTSNRPIATVGREVKFQGAIVLSGQEKYVPPHRVRLEIDGKHARDLRSPAAGSVVPRNGRVTFEFTHRFPEAGSHLVSVIIDPDLPPNDRPQGYVPRDQVPGDNRQDYSVEVISALPVLIIDGEPSGAPPPTLGSDFLRDALSPARDTTPNIRARVVMLSDFTPEMLTAVPVPRVVILHDVARLTIAQQEGLASYIAGGGGVLVCPGARAESDWYNSTLYRGGNGWLPGTLDGLAGDEETPANGVRPDPVTFTHSALEMFRRLPQGGLADARFPRWWKLATPGQNPPGSPMGQFQGPTGKFPFLLERTFHAGRVLLSSVPMDASWGSNLPELPSFVPLAHELAYYLAGARSAEFNLAPGRPIRIPVPVDAEPGRFTLTQPGGDPRRLSIVPGEAGTYLVQRVDLNGGAFLVFDGVRESGVYTVRTPANVPVYYVVPADAREGDLTPLSKDERAKVEKLASITFTSGEDEAPFLHADSESARQDIWLFFLLCMMGLLCLEVWLTRRLVMNR